MNEEDDFLLDDEDEGLYEGTELQGEDEEDEDELSDPDEEDRRRVDSSLYKGKLDDSELWFITAYDDIAKAKDLSEACFVVVSANPQHTSANTVNQIIKEIFHKQGHSRMQNIQYHQGPLHGDDMRAVVDEEDDDVNAEINNELTEETRNLIDSFVKYLVERDLSEDSVVSKRRKQRQLPAFIIYLFSSGMYDLILDCPSMPEIYRNQINFALKKINQTKYEILEEMAKKYEEKGRDQVAAKIREMGLSWFYKEPAEIKSAAEFRDLKLTSEDVDIYREFRPRYTNVSAAITQEVISDYIEVALDEKKGIFEKLKDKTRAEAINDVKRLFKKWLEQYNLENSSLADKLMFK